MKSNMKHMGKGIFKLRGVHQNAVIICQFPARPLICGRVEHVRCHMSELTLPPQEAGTSSAQVLGRYCILCPVKTVCFQKLPLLIR